ncbi:MAG: hypothetical protein WA917_13675 [Comamonas sp.]
MHQASLIDAPSLAPEKPDIPPAPCPICQHVKEHPNPISGRYNLCCAPCGARLVRSARPLCGPQEAMLAAIANTPGAPTREQVLQALRELDAQDAAARQSGAEHA